MSRHILVIADQADQWRLIRIEIEKNIPNCQSFWVGNLTQALEYLHGKEKSQLPDLILLDLFLPTREEGWQVLQAIKKDNSLNFIPVVVFSQSNNRDDIVRSYELGCSSYMIKPLDAAEWSNYFSSINTYWWHTTILPLN